VHLLLADAAPSGAGLAIVGIILLVMLALVVAALVVVVLVIRWLVRRNRASGSPPMSPAPAGPGTGSEGG
jgi:uncharacterized SAM-binding protein YcdF (DUF218 family)